MRQSLAALTCLLLCALCVPATAHAQAQAPRPGPKGAPTVKADEGNLKQARESFQRGVQAAERQDYATAAQRFREALALHYAPAVAFNLAAALAELGQPVEAYNLVQEVLAAEDVPAAVRPRAEKLLAALEPEIARLTVTTSGSTGDVSAEVDGKPLPAELLGRPQAIKAGQHEVAALRSGQVVSRRMVELAPRTTTIVDLSLIVTESAAPAPAAPAPVASKSESEHERSRRRRKILWISVAAGAAAVVAGATVATLLLVRKGDEAGAKPPIPGDSGVLTW